MLASTLTASRHFCCVTNVLRVFRILFFYEHTAHTQNLEYLLLKFVFRDHEKIWKGAGETNNNKNKLTTPNISTKQIFRTERNQFQLLFLPFFLFFTWYYFVHRLPGASHLNSTAFFSLWSSLGAAPWQYRGIEAQRQLHNQCKKFCKFHTLLLAKKRKKTPEPRFSDLAAEVSFQSLPPPPATSRGPCSCCICAALVGCDGQKSIFVPLAVGVTSNGAPTSPDLWHCTTGFVPSKQDARKPIKRKK